MAASDIPLGAPNEDPRNFIQAAKTPMPGTEHLPVVAYQLIKNIVRFIGAIHNARKEAEREARIRRVEIKALTNIYTKNLNELKQEVAKWESLKYAHTWFWDEHPEDYNDPCLCATCRSYADE
jgi:hypothetical protein